MVGHFNKCVVESKLLVKDMIQISMDGPNVNWKFFEIMRQNLSNDYNCSILNIGSCGLHVVHNSFKAGATASEWSIGSLLSGLYYLFKDSPARREDFVKVTGSSMLPLKFVSHRWLENVPVVDRALQLWDKIEKYVEAVETKKLPKPDNKSYRTISELVKDKLIKLKMHFFKCIAGQLLPFLTDYQTDRPMIPFLSGDLCTMIRNLMRRFIKSDILTAASTPDKLVKVDVSDKKHHVVYTKVDIGFLASKGLTDLKGKISERQILEFRMECITFLVKLLQKVLTKCPITYSLVRNMSALNPQEMSKHGEVSRTSFKKIVYILLSAKRIDENDCDAVLEQYSTFIDNIPSFGSDSFVNFSYKVDRVDEFLSTYLTSSLDKYGKLWNVVKMLLVLSHGQASVERGFSVNKEIEVENLKDQNLVAQRLVCDHVKVEGGVLNVAITKPLMVSVAMARNRYEHYLEEQRQTKKSAEQNRKRKRVLEELDDIKAKKARISVDIDSLTKSANDLSEKAEKTGNMLFVTKSNAFRRTAEDKKKDLVNLEEKLKEKLSVLKG